MIRSAMACFLLIMLSTLVFSQGVTTSSMKGKVVDDKGQPVSAANVVAVHTPSGTQNGTITRDDGRFSIRNMRVGGPYTVEIYYVGYESSKEENISLQLNKTAELDFTLTQALQQLDEVVVAYDKDDVINSERTGAMTNISREQIDFRFAQDFTVDVKRKKNTLQVSLDIMNIGNMFNSDWGVRKFASTTNPLTFNGVDGTGTPWFNFDTNLADSYVNGVNVRSK